ncbi:hypothetical protein EYF80_019697 [Liparis tanakae]|uniref:Secreted protein n=1 Tax=Liparis tanakae TaxID=230148 RepID=A0A4Z2HWR8_9TELE|nr:hypothetical protein EYF80_019697 [Liparis tanakae]
MLKLKFLGVFKSVSLILVCPFLSLPEESASDISPAQLFPAAGTSRAKPHLCPHLVSSSHTHSPRDRDALWREPTRLRLQTLGTSNDDARKQLFKRVAHEVNRD